MADVEKREKLIRAMEYCTADIVPVDENDECLGDVCSFKEGAYESGDCQENMIRAALELLREQEPRVLMLEDVHRDHDRVLWIECDDSKTQSIGQYRGQVYWHDRRGGKWERFVTIGFANDYLYRESEKYGKTWRCWTSRPTEEQRRKEAWDA